MILRRSFYNRPAKEVARDLLGKELWHGPIGGRIVETEAYPGGDDRASHSAAGITKRTAVIFGPPGHAYVYLIYGIHECFNVVCEPKGRPGCVLIRALEPIAGIDGPANGPGKLACALAITRANNGADLTRGSLVIRDGLAPAQIEVTPRIGITKNADSPLRFTAVPTKSP